MHDRKHLISFVVLATVLLAACGSKDTSGSKVEFALKTGIQGDKLVFIGVGGNMPI